MITYQFFQITDIGINCPKNNSVYNKRRIVTDRNICEIISELEETEWGEILNSDDVNFSYETFVNKLTDIYSKNCPAATGKVNNKRPNKPWMTSGLKNACKKKNLLYKYFLKSRSKQSEDKYKTYKNKLTTILRKCEKNYNTKLLELNKGNLKETWRLQACCAVTTEYGIPSNFIRKSTASLQIKISTAQLNFSNRNVMIF